LPPPSPSKLQASVFSYLTDPGGGCGIPPQRVQEEVPSAPTTDDTEGGAEKRQLDWLGYSIDLLVFPRGKGGGVGPLAVEVDGPHHFLLEDGAWVGIFWGNGGCVGCGMH
jgi:hypothetical protein